MPAPRWLARFNLHVTNHLLGPLARRLSGMGIVVHRGRKSHQQYETPVMYFRDGKRFIFALTYGKESQWVKNVLAEGGCNFQTQGRVLKLANPHLFHDEERRSLPALHRAILSLINVSDFLELTPAS